MVQIKWRIDLHGKKLLRLEPVKFFRDVTSTRTPLQVHKGEFVFVRPLHFCHTIYFLLGQFSGSAFQIIPATFWPSSKCFTLDEGICLWGKGLHCPGGGGEEVVSVLLPICHCTQSLISANRPEEPSPAGPREEAEDFRATDSGILAMRFDASIHWPETLDLNGAAWLCPCLA